MKLYRVCWDNLGIKRYGYLKAINDESADIVAKLSLAKNTTIISITEAQGHQITPQNITINFRNTTECELF